MVKLVPVEGNPFETSSQPRLTPVEGDPFKTEAKPTSSYAPRVAREGMPVNRKEAMKEQILAERGDANSMGNRMGSAWRGMVDAIPFASDAVAGLATAVPADFDYSLPKEERFARNRDYVEAQLEVDRDQNLGASLAGTVGGALLLPGSRYIAGAKGLPGVMGRSGVVGGGYGVLSGLSSNGSAQERTTQGVQQGALGLGLGAAAPAVVKGVAAGANEVFGPMWSRYRQWRDPDAAADRMLGNALRADRANKRTISQADLGFAEREGLPIVLGDIGGDTTRGLARAAANVNPVARGAMEAVLDPRFEGQNTRMGNFVANMFDFPDPEAMSQRLTQARQREGNRLYPKLYDDFQMVGNDDLLDMVRNVPEVRAAAEEVMRRVPGMRAAGMTRGPMSTGPYPSLEFWDRTQRILRDKARSAYDAGESTMAELYGNLRQRMVSQLDDLTGGRFAEARGSMFKLFNAEDAIEAGQNFFKKNGLDDLAAARKAIEKMSDADRQMFAQGFAAELAHAAGNTRPGQNIGVQGWLTKPNAKEKMRLAFGTDRADSVEMMVNVEAAMNKLRSEVKGNSTSVRQLIQSGVMGVGLNTMLDGGFSWNSFTSPEGAMLALARAAASRNKGLNPAVAERLARRLISNDPKVIGKVLDQAKRSEAIGKFVNDFQSQMIKLGSIEGDAVLPAPKGYAEGGPVDALDSMAGMLPPGAAEPMREEFGPPAPPMTAERLPELDPWQTEKAIGRGAVEAVGTAGRYLRDTPLSQIPRDVGKVGGMMWEGIKEDPMGAVLDVLPGIGQVRAAMDADELAEKAAEAEAAGNPTLASELRQFATLAAAGVVPGAGLAGKGAKKAAKGAKSTVTAGDAVVDAEHVMGIERGQRATINPSSVRLTDAEKAIVNELETPALQAKAATAIRAKKANYPPSAGWEPMEVKSVSFDEKTGEPVLEWKAASYGFNRGNFDVERTATDPSGAPLKQPKLDASGNPVLDVDGNPVMTNRNVKETVKENFAPRRGTPEHTRLINKIVRGSLSEIRDIIRRANEGDEAAQVILRQAGWYRETMRKGFDERGGAYPAFADLLGGTSPNTSVDQNYAYSVDLQKRFARGDFDDDVAFTRDYQGNLNEFPEDRLLRRNDAFDEDGTGKQYGMNSRNAAMALADRWREEVPGQAPKARNLSGNLGGQTDKATIDVWAARFINRMAGRKRLPPALEAGVGGSLGKDLRAGGEFGFGQDVFAKLSDELNKSGELQPFLQQLGYNDVTPMDLQALTWFIEKEHWGRNGWTTKAGEGGSFEDEMRKFPTQRWQSGFSVQQAEPPTDDIMLAARQAVEAPLKTDDGVRVFRVNPTYGRYAGTNERSFDVELSAKPGWDPRQWMAAVIDQAKQNNQYDVFFSRRLSPTEAVSNPNARPGVEIYFKSRQEMEKILPLLEQFTSRGTDGFTFVTDLKLRERLAGGSDVPDYVGVRLQFVPEITARWDDTAREAWLKDPAALQKALEAAEERMQDAIEAIGQNAEVVDARIHKYDTLAVGKESYDQFLRGIADPDGSSRQYEEAAGAVDPLARFGQPVRSHVEGRDRALRKGAARGPEDDGGAVSGVVSGNPLSKAKGGPVKKRGGPRGRPVDSSPDELHQYLLATSNLAPPPRRFAMGGPVFPAAVEPRMNALTRPRRGALSQRH